MSDDDGGIVIEIKEARRLMHLRIGGCQHTHILVDEEKAEIECAACHAKLNPAVWLVRYMNEINDRARMVTRYEAVRRAYELKRRSKCSHCGRISEIRPPTEKEIAMEGRARVAEGSVVLVPSSPAPGDQR